MTAEYVGRDSAYKGGIPPMPADLFLFNPLKSVKADKK